MLYYFAFNLENTTKALKLIWSITTSKLYNLNILGLDYLNNSSAHLNTTSGGLLQ